MHKHLKVLLLLIAAFAHLAVSADDGTTLQRLAEWVQKARGFNNEYTREKVYVHLDNNAYFVGETMWLKAYVLRASNLSPVTGLSRVLYVDLIDATGETIEQKLVRIDDRGQAEGEFELKAPVTSGYYEVRAYTRAMTNWDAEACFSRVVPVFRAKEKDADPSQLSIDMPDEEYDMVFGHKRPMDTGRNRALSVMFYPEGGNRIGGMQQRVAYKMINGKGNAVDDVLTVCRADGSTICESRPEIEGMGVFTLPDDIPAAEAIYVSAAGQRFDLPAVATDAHYALSAVSKEGSVAVNIRSDRTARPQLLGLLVSCRTRPCYFDTLSVYSGDDIELELPRSIFREGVNSIDLFDETGHSLCQRLVWNTPADTRTLQLSVRQNERIYDAFAPVAVELQLSDADGAAVSDASLSVSVRNADADVVAAPTTDMLTELLLSSEVRGYVNHPEQYFAADDDAHRAALDLLLMVQGWSADNLATVVGAETFELRQPVEDKLMLRGQVLRDNERHDPWPGLDLHLQMYSLEGASLESDVRTDKDGRFAFVSNVDFCGEWYAQITTKENVTDRRGNDKAKRRWSRVTLDRWFEPALCPISSEALVLVPPAFRSGDAAGDEYVGDADLFAWEDTIQRVVSRNLAEAKVIGRGKYRGLVGNRYTYNGGEAAGLRHSSFYINVARENERRKDAGRGEGTILDILEDATTRTLVRTDAKQMAKGEYDGWKEQIEQHMDRIAAQEYIEVDGSRFLVFPDGKQCEHNAPVIELNNRPCIFFLNNDLVGYGYRASQIIDDEDPASEFKSIVVMTERKDWQKFWPVGRETTCSERYDPYFDGRPYYGVFVYNRENPFRFYTKKGVDKRSVQGFSVPKKFYQPQYNGIDLPDENDCRRTLCWQPTLTTDKDGRASLVFFNSADAERLSISVRGVTADGRFVTYER